MVTMKTLGYLPLTSPALNSLPTFIEPRTALPQGGDDDRFHLLTSMYRYARIGIPRLGSTFRFHTSHRHVAYITMCDGPACHVSNCHLHHNM
jgi:hypothetical protein